ncbi:MAG: S8 family serine peptidase [Prevotella sp.]|nr:S8 family serine peptidase [Prevotella sp.]
MKKVVFSFFYTVFCIPLFAQLGYWHHSKFLELTPLNDSVYYLNFNKVTSDKKHKLIAESGFVRTLAKFSDNQFLVKKKGKLDTKGCYVSTKYKSKTNGGEMVILPQIAISVEKPEIISSILKDYIDILSVYNSFRDIYELDCNLASSDEVLRLSMKINSIEGVNWCEPNKMLNIIPNNVYYPFQYYINNSIGYDINVVNAWEITSGEPNITVAVIDCGVDMNHEDLSANLINGYTVGHPTSFGSYLNNNHSHGTACAGIIGAVNNTVGIRGVASNIKILPINISTGESDFYGNPIYADEFKIANAIRWAVDNGADILSCSWGGNSSSSDIEAAIIYALTEGRNMRGSVVVCASGNGAPQLDFVAFPARMDNVIAVGAVDRDGTICHYSQHDPSIDIVAPSNKIYQYGDVYTTSITGKGNINNNYMDDFGGTSAACPQVAGVAALMLSFNPQLTADQVRNKLRMTARDLGDFGPDDTYGCGLVNAYAAVCASAHGDGIIGAAIVNANETYTIDNLQSGATVEWSLSDSYYNQHCLQQNYPATNQCTITRSNNLRMINATLTATIKYNGIVINTLTKTVSAYTDFYGEYTCDTISGTIDYTHTFYVRPGYATFISSPNLVNATVSYNPAGTTPLYLFLEPTQWRLSFTTPINNNGIPVILEIDDVIGNHYQLYAMPRGSFYFSIAYEGDYVNITLENDEEKALKTMAIEQPWSYEIRSASMGALKASKSVNTRSTTISTVGWPKGVYIIKAKIGKEEVTEKIVVK